MEGKWNKEKWVNKGENKTIMLVISFLDVKAMGLNGPEDFHPNFLPAEPDHVTAVA